MYDLVFLFFSSFLAATIFPAQSEAVLLGLKITSDYHILLLLFIATVGNVLGATLNWSLGGYFMRFRSRKWFPFKTKALTNSIKIYKKYGIWTLLMSSVPLIGDGFTVVAGMLRINILLFLILVTIGKLGRYVLLVTMFR